MLRETYKMLAERSDTYWWHRARRAMSVDLLRRAGLKRSCRHLDLGCGPGGNLALLTSMEPALVVGLDLSSYALELARAGNGSRATLVQADLKARLPFADRAFDVVTIYNVLYHQWVANEAPVLAEVARVLQPGGLLLVTEPAFRLLAREMDRAAMGRKRYLIGEMTELCQRAGLRVLRASYFTSFGFPLLLGMRAFGHKARQKEEDERAKAADMRPLPRTANTSLYLAARLEATLLAAGMYVPCGTTLVCLARKS